ncbi:MAG: tetratricopeptide repeat protein [Proteobacteria bacterium]|nr:tetratricopeptide repeat protein [Pseudomonadota bacterium]
MKHLVRRLSGIFLSLLVAACATAPELPATAVNPIFHDERFAAPVEPILDADQVFALSDAMKHYLHVEIAPQLRGEGLSRGLIDALSRHDQLKLEYDSEMTRTAAQAFDARRGNCLSLVIMTAALAREIGLQVNFQSVATDETWSRADDIAFSSGHVNLTLGQRPLMSTRGYDEYRLLTVDFLPAEDVIGQYTRPVSEKTIVAMFMNNRSAEALATGRVDDAYWWARAAIRNAPEYASPYNTLGVVYLRHGDTAAAEQTFRVVLERKPGDLQAMSNLVVALDKLGRKAEADPLRAQLARIEPNPPFAYYRRGMAAFQRGDYAVAKEMFEKEVARADYNGELHFWLGVAQLRLGNDQAARKELQLALKNSTTRNDHAMYAAKLDHLLSQRTQ